ncbi:hypothetical protein C3941_17210 [Kaistia algarum]|uniref:hypothetical protein n=1 Tax=Kaistia algarum TaxID=2083279 RepID=UPI000CE73EF8|nr:hypothetical protein [Kaistia algarum]MCX5516298.1 hypothetical protein [Kaistia algarum]PPE78781.1 hypothetical protein C3941_17210 [Kaistia algarum]
MIRWIVALALVVLSAGTALASGKAVEIGYVESFERGADGYSIVSDGVPKKVAILEPILNGDLIQVRDPTGSITLRLVGRDDPVVISQANQSVPITAEVPEKGFWSGLFSWTSGSVAVFDDEQRQQVTASIRGDDGKELIAPLFATPQTLVAGRRKLSIGWSTPRTVDIQILAKGAKRVAEGRASGGLWATPEIDWKAGTYRIEIASGADVVRQTLTFVAPKKAPPLPAEFSDPAVPAPLRAVASAAWYAAKDPAYLLEALQYVAPDARTSRPAKLLTLAFIDGKRPPPPPAMP